ncbi:CDP-glycerol glycerophosphotransferase family protein, partial [Staphylococcus aureus]|nr:CDP-glycerol glycerophosphotransferase family protein [Staphylococcus aureus]
KYLDLNINNETILMSGFDYQYRGNSKYLFNYLQQNFSPNQLKIVSFDKNTNDEYRIAPRSDEFYKYLYTSKVIIGESWIPLAFKKREAQVWIQLWHGTPF